MKEEQRGLISEFVESVPNSLRRTTPHLYMEQDHPPESLLS